MADIRKYERERKRRLRSAQRQTGLQRIKMTVPAERVDKVRRLVTDFIAGDRGGEKQMIDLHSLDSSGQFRRPNKLLETDMNDTPAPRTFDDLRHMYTVLDNRKVHTLCEHLALQFPEAAVDGDSVPMGDTVCAVATRLMDVGLVVAFTDLRLVERTPDFVPSFLVNWVPFERRAYLCLLVDQSVFFDWLDDAYEEHMTPGNYLS